MQQSQLVSAGTQIVETFPVSLLSSSSVAVNSIDLNIQTLQPVFNERFLVIEVAFIR